MVRFVRDLHSSARGLLRNPGFALTSVLTLAISIGALTSVFSVVDTVLLRPLPYGVSESRLVAMAESWSSTETWGVSYPNFRDWQGQADRFESMAAYGYVDMNIADAGNPQHLLGMRVSTNFFETLGVKPFAGRDFNSVSGSSEPQQAAVISFALWKRRYSSAPECIGRTLTVNGRPFTIVGILPSTFRFYWSSDIYVPIGAIEPADELADRAEHGSFYVVGRLKDGTTIREAQAQMGTIAKRLGAAYPKSNENHTVKVSGLRQNMENMIPAWRPVSLVLMAGAVFLLLLTCSNVANLLLARLNGRRKEIALRTALGATSGKLFGQLLSENMLIVVIGAGLALPLSAMAAPQLLRLTGEPDVFPFLIAQLDWRIFAFTILSSCIAALACTLPGVHFLREQSPQELLKSSDSVAVTSPGAVRTQQALVMIEVALAFALAVNTTVLLRTLHGLFETRLTFDSQKLLTMRLPASPQVNWKELTAFDASLLQSVSRVPGVRAAAVAFPIPFTHDKSIDNFMVAGRPVPPASETPQANFHQISADYFQVVGVPLLRGRTFSQSDYQDHAPCVVILNHTAVQSFWNGNDPVGTEISLGPSVSGRRCSIVGVVADVKEYKLGALPESEVYLASYGGEGLLILGSVPAEAIKLPVIREVHALNAEQSVYDIATMEQRLSDSLRKERSVAQLILAFALAAMLVAAAGIFAIVAQFVTQRTRELGIRIAVGASRQTLLLTVFRRGLMPVLPGIAAGLILAFWSARTAEALLFNVKNIDAASFIITPCLLLFVTVLACYIPARRALRIDPARVLRE